MRAGACLTGRVLCLWLAAAGMAAAQGGVTRPQLQPEHRAATPGEQRCLDAFRAETARIERDLAGRAPSKHDSAAYQAWATDLHRLLQQAGDRAEACSRTARAPFAAAAATAAEQCRTRATLALAAVDRRYAGRTLGSAELTARRNEETRVLDERHACDVAAMRR
jgi:hypothetical protein